MQQRMRERVWEAANVRLTSIALDTDTTVHTLYGRQMSGRKATLTNQERSDNPLFVDLGGTLIAPDLLFECVRECTFTSLLITSDGVLHEVAGLGRGVTV